MIKRLKNFFAGASYKHHCEYINAGVFHFVTGKEKVYIKCGDVAIKELPYDATIGEIINEIEKLKNVAIKYEGELYDTARL